MLIHRWYQTVILCAIVIFLASGCRFPEITSPSGDITIDAGESISFTAASYPNAIYKWTFDGGAKDALGQNPTVRFDRPGVYFACLHVVYEDLESGIDSLMVTVNDPSTTVYTLTESNYEVTSNHPNDAKLIWIIENDGIIVMRRNAQGESTYTYHDNTSGNYRIWLARFYGGTWTEASNIISYSVP